MNLKDFDFIRPEIMEYEFKPLRNTFIFKTKFPEIPPNIGTLEYIFDCLKPYLKALNCPNFDKLNMVSNIAYREVLNFKHHIYLYLNPEKSIYLTFRHREGLISDITLYNLAFSEAEEENSEVIEAVSESVIIVMDKKVQIVIQIPDFTPISNFNIGNFEKKCSYGLDPPPLIKNIFQKITSKKLFNNNLVYNIRYG